LTDDGPKSDTQQDQQAEKEVETPEKKEMQNNDQLSNGEVPTPSRASRMKKSVVAKRKTHTDPVSGKDIKVLVDSQRLFISSWLHLK
jgi:hypothetical protein